VVVSKHDDAIDHDNTDWDEYVKEYDMTKLTFLPEKEPTRFVCNFKFNADESAELKNSMMSTLNKTTREPNLSIGSYQQNVVRFGLKEVQNPDYLTQAERLTIKKNGRYIRNDTLAELEECGLVDEIFNAYNVLAGSNRTAGNEKNL